LILTPRHAPEESLAEEVEFALKWEGVDLGVLKWLLGRVPAEAIAAVVRAKPTGVYARRLWFLYEWLMGAELDIQDPGKVKSVPAVDPKHRYVSSDGQRSSRHKVVNNLPGPPEFCPLVRRTPALVARIGVPERSGESSGPEGRGGSLVPQGRLTVGLEPAT
jgi:hypothetical protein